MIYNRGHFLSTRNQVGADGARYQWNRLIDSALSPERRILHVEISLRVGENFACIDNRQLGRRKTLLLCVARIGQALLVNMPLLVWAYLLGDRAGILGRKCLLWRAVAYTRGTLFLLAPRLFPQKGFFAALEFRKERKSFTKS